MRILHLINEPWDSGVTAYGVQVAALLKENGHEVLVGVGPGKRPEALAQMAGLKTIAIENFFDLRKILGQFYFDVVNAHTGSTHTWAVLGRLLGRSPNRSSALIRTRGDARLLKINFLDRFIYRYTQAVIAPSDHVRKQYENQLGWGEDQLITIYPAVDPDENIKTPQRHTVGILGRLDPVKGHSTFLEAATRVLEEIPEAKFLVAGKEAGISISLLKNQAVELGIQNSVQFLGLVSSSQEFMRQCEVGVIASIGSEEVSRACLEWMSVGRPVVGTLVGCLPELIETEETGLLVSPGDSEALGNAILKLLKNKKLASAWGHKAWQQTKKNFSPPTLLEKTLHHYQQAMVRAVQTNGR